MVDKFRETKIFSNSIFDLKNRLYFSKDKKENIHRDTTVFTPIFILNELTKFPNIETEDRNLYNIKYEYENRVEHSDLHYKNYKTRIREIHKHLKKFLENTKKVLKEEDNEELYRLIKNTNLMSGEKVISLDEFELLFKRLYKLILSINYYIIKSGKMTPKEMNETFSSLLEVEILNLKKENPIMNEIIEDFKNEKESLNVPFDFQLLKEVRNKKELIELKLQKVKRKYKTYNCFNKMSLNGVYSLLKANKYLEEKDFPKYQNIDYKEFHSKEQRRVQSFLMYLLKKIMIEDIKDENYLYDYIRVLIMLKGKYKINLNIKTNKKLISEHDKIYKIYKKAKFRKDKMVIEENNPFLKLKLPKDIKILDTKKKLFDEGERMEHCAYTYLPHINNGRCMLYTYLKDGKRYTIEIIKNGKKFSLNQLKGYKNSEPPQEVIEYVENAIEQANIVLKNNKKASN